MPVLKNYRLFISHSWTYTEEYSRFVNLLNNASYFQWQNYSVPDEKPLPTTSNRELKTELLSQMKSVNCVVILAGMYTNYSDWINSEMEIAISLKKPMIGIAPLGSQRIPIQVQNKVKVMVNWNTNSIINAIRQYSI